MKKFIAENRLKLETKLIVYLLSSTCLDILKDKISSSQFDISAYYGITKFTSDLTAHYAKILLQNFMEDKIL